MPFRCMLPHSSRYTTLIHRHHTHMHSAMPIPAGTLQAMLIQTLPWSHYTHGVCPQTYYTHTDSPMDRPHIAICTPTGIHVNYTHMCNHAHTTHTRRYAVGTIFKKHYRNVCTIHHTQTMGACCTHHTWHKICTCLTHCMLSYICFTHIYDTLMCTTYLTHHTCISQHMLRETIHMHMPCHTNILHRSDPYG